MSLKVDSHLLTFGLILYCAYVRRPCGPATEILASGPLTRAYGCGFIRKGEWLGIVVLPAMGYRP